MIWLNVNIFKISSKESENEVQFLISLNHQENQDTYHSVLSTDRSIKLLADKTFDVSFLTVPGKERI